jgi:type I restriction enzyme, S subunit
VARIEALAEKIKEDQGFCDENSKDLDLLLICMAHRNDLDDKTKSQNGWKKIRMKEVLKLVDNSQAVQADKSYPNLGIYSFGRGLFHKPPIDGALTSAKTLRRVKKGQFIYSRLFAFEGAYGMAPEDFDGYFVSNEYPTFDCIATDIRVEFIMAYFNSPFIWQHVATGSKGLGDRRQRVQPERILAHEIWLPPMKLQDQIAEIQTKVNDLRKYLAHSAAELDALLPSILDKAFKGEL